MMEKNNLIKIILLEAVLVIYLSIFITNDYLEDHKDGLLSSKIYTGALEPKSYLITNFQPLENSFSKFIQNKNYNISIYVENLRNGVSFSINGKENAFPASLNKIPIAVLIMQEVEKGNIKLDQKINIEKFNTGYNKSEVSISFLLQKMLSESDNEAFKVLFELVNKEELSKLMNYYNIDLLGSYSVNNAQNLLGAKEMSNMFSSLYFSSLLEAKNSEYILGLLSKNELNMKNFSKLPEDVKLVDKYGGYYIGNKKLFHDCGIIYYQDSRILYCIMTRDLDTEKAVEVTASIIQTIYKYTKESKIILNEYKERGYI